MKIKTVTVNEYTIEPHKYALEAYKSSLEFDYQYSQLHYPKDSIHKLQTLQPLHATIKNDTIKFYSNWHMLNLALINGVENLLIISNNHITNSEIEEASWNYLIFLNLVSLNRRSNLSQFKSILEKIPIDHRKKIFGNIFHSYSSTATIQNLSSESRDAIRNQINKLESTSKNQKSIFESLI